MAQRQLAKLSDDQLYADWVRWIDRAYREAIGQAWRHKMFRLVRCIYQQNPELQKTGGFFLQWMVHNYVDAASIALRRELDDQAGTENLFKMLCEMKDRPGVLSRQRFRSTWTGNLEHYTADDEFDKLPVMRHRDGRDSDYIDPAMIDDDLNILLSAKEAVMTHIQTVIAHRAPPRPNAPIPTFGELLAAIEKVGEVFDRYYTLLTHKALMGHEPVQQFSILEPFTMVWIPDPEQFDCTALRASPRPSGSEAAE